MLAARTVSQTIKSTFCAPAAAGGKFACWRYSDQTRPPWVTNMVPTRIAISHPTVRRTNRKKPARRDRTSRTD